MKILYLTPSGTKEDLYSADRKSYDFDSICNRIKKGIINNFKDIEITFPKDILVNEEYILDEKLVGYDLFLCDLTTYNPNISYIAGVVQGMSKPIIYFSSSDNIVLQSVRHRNVLKYSEATLENEFRKGLNDLIEIVKKDPSKFIIPKKNKIIKPRAFISYSHNDKEYLDRLLIHLKPLEKNGLIDIWQDSKIKTGELWKDEIDKALSKTNIVILMISADFMASDFIVNNELPPLLSKAEVKGTKIVPVVLSHCRFSREPTLNRFQAANSPDKPLSIMTKNEREAIYDKVASEIEDALKNA